MQTLIGVYPDPARLGQILDTLDRGDGIRVDQVLVARSSSPDGAPGPGADRLLPLVRLHNELLRLGVPRSEVETFEAEVRRGHGLLIVTVPDSHLINAQRVLTGMAPLQQAATVSPRTPAADIDEDGLGPDYWRAYDELEPDFQDHHRQHHADQDPWGTYRPAYRAGYAYGAHHDYLNMGFDAAEAGLRGSYTRRYSEEAWNRHRAAVRYAYEQARSRHRR